MPKMNFDNEKYVYFCSHPKQISHNGLYIIRAGETYPNPLYFHEREATFYTHLDGLLVIEYVYSGRGYIECDDKRFIVEAGDMFVLTRYHAHKYYADPITPFHKKWVNLAGPLVANIAEALNLTDGVYIKHFDSPRYIDQIHSLLEQYNEVPKQRIFDNIALTVTEILLIMNSSRKEQKAAVSPIILEIKKYIDREENVSVNLDDVCAKFSINKSYAIATFKREFGITLYQYLLEKKIRAAEEMLIAGKGINQIAEELGYSCSQSFTHAFKSVVGISPTSYRDKNMHK